MLLVVLVVHLVLARFTLRDLRRRSDSAVRGPKRLWRVWAITNTTGSLAYWTFGRRRVVTPADVTSGGSPGHVQRIRTLSENWPSTARSPAMVRLSAPARFHKAR